MASITSSAVRGLCLTLGLLLVACSNGGTTATTAGPTATSLASTTTEPSPSTTSPPVECPLPPYEPDFLPFGVGVDSLDPADIEPDVWTSEGGTSTIFWGRDDGTVAIALVRGDLPAVEWPGDKGEIFVDGTRGVVGPHADGTWVAGWAEQPTDERCNSYSMIFYPPVAPSDVEETLLGLNRVGG